MSTIAWPQVMTAATAATYCGERSVRAFRRRVGSVYPVGRVVRGRGELWWREDLDAALAVMMGRRSPSVGSAADLL